MADKNAADGGMLGTGNRTPPFFRNLINLYKIDLPFRGLIDFAVIGAAVMFFLHPPGLESWSPLNYLGGNFGGGSGGGGQSGGGSQSGGVVQPGPGSQTKTGVQPGPQPGGNTQTQTTDASPPVPYADEVKRPALTHTMLIEIDETAFRSSPPAEQQKLTAAARAFRSRQYVEIMEILKDARASDPNVGFMRGMSLANRGDVDSRKIAAQNFQMALDAGQRQAAVVYGRMLLTAPEGIAKNVELGRQLIDKAVTAGDRQAQRTAAIAYMSGEFGVFDPVKARDLFSKSAQAGDPQAMLQYSSMLFSGIAGSTDHTAAADYLRRAAAAGLTGAQVTLGNWLIAQYKAGTLADPREGVEWLERAYQTGHSIGALVDLSAFYINTGRAPPWNDKNKYFELVQMCSGISSMPCQFNVGLAYQNGWGTDRDLVKAYAHYQISKQLGYEQGGKNAVTVESQLTSSERATANELTRTVQAALKPLPGVWYMQYPGVTPPPAPWTRATYGAPPSTPTPGPDADKSAGVVMDFDYDHVKAAGFLARWIDIDVSAFRSSTSAVQTQLYAAARAYREGRWGDMLGTLKDAGSDGNVEFMRAIGTYFTREGADGNGNQQAERLLRSAIAGGQRQAAALLGSLLIYAPAGITKNVAEGRRLLEQGVERKERYAYRQLGLALASGNLGGPDPTAAVRYLKASADAGDPAANLLMAAFLQAGAGAPKDMMLAENYLRQGAKLGLTNAQYVLGRYLLDRYRKNEISGPEEALQWLDRAFRSGTVLDALVRTLLFYADSPQGSPWRNRPKALELARNCIEFKFANCHAYYAFLMHAGEGNPVDNVRSYAHYDVSRTLGNSNAVKSLDEREKQLTSRELATARDLSRAIQQRLKPLPDAVIFQPPMAN